MLDQITLNDVVIDAAREVFETMIFMDIETDSEAQPEVVGQAITSTINFKSKGESDLVIDGKSMLGSVTFKGALEGCLSISTAQSCAECIAKNMLGMEPDEPLELNEICDAIGEVANMVMGSIKTRIQNIYTDIEVSIPSVVTGCELRNTLGDNASKVVASAWLDEQESIEFTFLYREAAA